jgi:uncharacterized protein
MKEIQSTNNLPWNIIPFPKTEYQSKFPFIRPEETDRKFISPVIEEVIKIITSNMKDKDLARLFENCWPNTLGNLFSD